MTITDEMVEAAARSIATLRGYDPDETWEESTRLYDENFLLESHVLVRWREFEPEALAALEAVLPMAYEAGIDEGRKRAMALVDLTRLGQEMEHHISSEPSE